LKLKAYQALTKHFSNEEAVIIVEYIESSKGSEERSKNILITEDRLTKNFM
jgi:hypothetical protein